MTDNKQNCGIEKQISSELIYDGKVVHLYVDKISLPNGNPATREYIRHQGAVCVLPVLDGCALMVEQYRYPFADFLLEAPAGKIDPGETPLEAAVRELEEETGAKAETVTAIGKFYPTCAYSDEVIYLYIAEGLTINELCLDEDEFLSVKKIPLIDLKKQILENGIPDGKTQAILLKAFLKLGI